MNRRFFLKASTAAGSLAALPYEGLAQTLQDCPTGPYPLVPRTQDHLYRPKPQFWSFDNQDPVIAVGDFHLSFQIFTTGPEENSYGLLRHSIQTTRTGDNTLIRATAFAGAGQQTSFKGGFEAFCKPTANGLSLSMKASSEVPIRAVKVRLHRLPSAKVFQTGWNVDPNGLPIVADGINFAYPEYQGGMPCWQLQFESGSLGIVSTDLQPRPKRLTAYMVGEERVVELVYEEDARRFQNSIEVPAWELSSNLSLNQVIARRQTILENGASLKPWSSRTDVPDWARQVKLVVTLHGMHWSGFIFNDYARMLKIVDWVTKQMLGREVVFFLAAWEGRYYRKYGDSQADDRMGGTAGLEALMHGIHSRGSHAMAFFSGNYPQPGLPHYEEYAPSSRLDASSGLRWDPMRGYIVDWAQLRGTGMAGGGPSLNPGAPAWQSFLTKQIAALNDRYGFDGTYFDTQPEAGNDGRYQPLDGLRTICSDLRSARKDLLISTESWFDLSLAFVPWTQTPGGPSNWTRRYQRRFAHLSLGEPSRGSTGTHELGHIPYNRADLNKMYDIPTLAFVDGTLELAEREILSVIWEAAGRTDL